MLATSLGALAADWSSAEQELAQKIAGVTGPGAFVFSMQNRSSLGKREADMVQNGLQSALEQAGVRLTNSDQAAASITLSLSENQVAYVWIAEIRQSAAESTVVMVAVPRPGALPRAPDSMPMTLRKTLLRSANDPMLDVAVLEDNGTPSRIAVLTAESLTFYRMQTGKWQEERTLAIAHAQPWPRDLRGRLVPGRDHSFDVYLPGVICHTGASGAWTINCHESDDPWPLAPAGANSAGNASPAVVAAFFAPRRNFFTGVISPSIGKFNSVPRFYSAAFVPRDKYTLWLFASTDGTVHMIDGIRDQVSAMNWGSDITTVKTTCGAGWQVLAATAGSERDDSLRAYEFPDRDPVAVSSSVDFPGTVSALWTEASGDSAIAIVKNRETGSYEAFRLAMACN